MKSVPEESGILGRAIRERTKSSAHQLWFLRGGREKLGFRCEGQNWFIVITQGASLARSVLLKREKGFVGQEDGGFCFVHNGRDGTDCTASSVCRHDCSAVCCVVTHGGLDCSFILKLRGWLVAMTGWRKVAGGPVLLSPCVTRKALMQITKAQQTEVTKIAWGTATLMLSSRVQWKVHSIPAQQLSLKIQVWTGNLFKAERPVLSAMVMVNALILLLLNFLRRKWMLACLRWKPGFFW